MNANHESLNALAEFLERHRPLFILTGAGCSTASGIPAYRDEQGEWKQTQPMDHQSFLANESNRKRYWARSMLGWPRVSNAEPASVHHALRDLEEAGLCPSLVTQNVDGLHQKAGNRRVLELHGSLQWVLCIDCGLRVAREEVQDYLVHHNPAFTNLQGPTAADGDVMLEGIDYEDFRIMACPRCQSPLKPDVVFYGESVPRERVDSAYQYLAEAGAMLVAGSSLMVYSAYRFCIRAAELGKPVAAINRGRTRADAQLVLKIEDDCGTVLKKSLEGLR